MERVWRGVLDVLFPLRCAGCGSGSWPFCPACAAEVGSITPPLCRRCGRPTDEWVQGCRDCPPDPVDAARSPFLYAGPVRSALHRLKFGGLRAVAEALGRAMATVATDVAGEAGIVTWVPVSRIRLARRGYDQARALAAVVCGQLGLPRARLLLRPTEIGPQARRSGPERRGALRGAFVSSGRDPPATVLLVDDVLTTGATAAECAEVLGAAGARRVVLLTAARSLSGRLPARCYSGPDSRPSLWLPGDRPR